MALNTTNIIDPISDRVRDILQYVNFVVLATAIGLFGVFTNIVNIVVYKRLGFKESMHVSLFAISLSDLGSLLTLLWTCVCANPAIVSSPLDIIPMEFQYLTGGVPHSRFMRITCWLTVLVTIERCMCLVSPHNVKRIFTPRSSTITCVLIFVFFLLTQTLNNLSYRLDWKFDKAENRSRIGVVPTSLLKHVRPFSVALNIALQFLSLSAILVSNFTLLYFLRKKMSWRNLVSGQMNTSREIEFHSSDSAVRRLNRQRTVTPQLLRGASEDTAVVASSRYLAPNTSGSSVAIIASRQTLQRSQLSKTPKTQQTTADNVGQTAILSSVAKTPAMITPIGITTNTTFSAAINSSAIAVGRDQKLCRMILLLSAIMILAYLPSTICLVLAAIYKEFGMSQRLSNSFIVAYSITFVFEATNASVNIFLYYMMSSKYRHKLDKMARCFRRKSRRIRDVGFQQEGTG